MASVEEFRCKKVNFFEVCEGSVHPLAGDGVHVFFYFSEYQQVSGSFRVSQEHFIGSHGFKRLSGAFQGIPGYFWEISGV